MNWFKLRGWPHYAQRLFLAETLVLHWFRIKVESR